MNTTPSWAAPGWHWLPPVVRSTRYWRLVGRFAIWGPLIGGAPCAWMVITLPFIYLFGLGPAVLAGMTFAAWLLAPGRRYPDARWRAALGMLCGALGCAVVALALQPRHPLGAWVFLAAHGVPAALILALTLRRAPAARRTAAQG
ncbi:MAG TPA: hypothetical protein VFU71_18065 [Burkholderiaceae bacterium]|nr:hypothetical protein [Burkholderiaceae bacterium]